MGRAVIVWSFARPSILTPAPRHHRRNQRVFEQKVAKVTKGLASISCSASTAASDRLELLAPRFLYRRLQGRHLEKSRTRTTARPRTIMGREFSRTRCPGSANRRAFL